MTFSNTLSQLNPQNHKGYMKKLTPEQIAKRDERRAKFKALWKQVAAMPELDRIKLSNKLGLVTCEGHALSLGNTMLIALQLPGATVLGGFRQWLKHGRCVRKGEHGAMIWVPTGGKKSSETTEATEATAENETRFIVGTVFDIGQTDELNAPVASVSPEIASAFGLANLPNVRVMEAEEITA